MKRNTAIGKVRDATRAEPVDTAALRASVEEAEAVGVEDEKFEGARHVLRASADRQVISQEEMLRAEVRLLQDALEEQRGVTLRAMMHAGVNATVAASGYTLHKLMAAGYVEGCKTAGNTCMEAKKGGFLQVRLHGQATGFTRQRQQASLGRQRRRKPLGTWRA